MDQVKLDLRKVFKEIKDRQTPITLRGYVAPQEATPVKDEDYVFQIDLLSDMICFFKSGNNAIQLIGHMGSGKSSLVEQFHAYLNLPLYVLSCGPRTESKELIGMYKPDGKGGFVWQYGPVAKAAMEGVSVLLDESNVMDPAEKTGLNALLEGRAIFVPETGEWVKPQAGFRVFETRNPKTLGYVGRNTQDGASEDRYVAVYVDYMAEADEVGLIKKCLLANGLSTETVALELAKKYRQVAAAVRNLFMGESDAADALDVTMSTRTLLRWVQWSLMNKTKKSPIHYGLERACTNKASPESRLAIHALVANVFGEEYDTPAHPTDSMTQAQTS